MTSLKLWKEPLEDKFWSDPFSGMIDLFFERPSFIEKVYKRSNVAATDEDYRIQLAVPGLSKDDVKISVDDSVISISHEQKETDDKTYYFTSSFRKEYSLPYDCEEDNITSKLENGILEIVIPRSKKKSSERLIEIK